MNHPIKAHTLFLDGGHPGGIVRGWPIKILIVQGIARLGGNAHLLFIGNFPPAIPGTAT